MCKIKVVLSESHFQKPMSRTFSGRKSLTLVSCSLFCLCLAPAAPQDPAQQSSQNQTQTSTNPDKKPVGPGAIDERKAPPTSTAPQPSNVPPPATAGAPVDSNAYKVGPADVLNIRVWNEPQFSGPVIVQQNGKFTLPLVGDLQAGGLTPVEIEQVITKGLAKLIVRPLVTVTVQEVGSKRYYMDGEIARPGEYPLVVPTTILEAISKAGGPGGFANEKKIYVLRGDKKIPFNLKEVRQGKHMEQNIQIQPGDHIFIP